MADNHLFKKLSKTLLENSAYDKETNTLFVTNPGISFDTLKGLAKKHGFAVGKTQSGNFVSIPLADKYRTSGYDNNDYIGLYDSFMETYTYYNKNYSTLLSAYKTIDLMDENLAEVGLILDTYSAEVLSTGFIDNPLKIKVSDKKAERIVEKILYKNKIYQRLPNIVRSLAKYGNYGMLLSYPYLETWLTDNPNADFNQIDVVEDLHIKFINPKYFKVNVDDYLNVVNYETTEENTYTTSPSKHTNINRVWQPWQFVHFSIVDEATEPYGKSMLWSMRSAFDQLSTLEALLGISRASKIQRLVFYVPIPNGTALTDAYGYMNEFKSHYLNSIFTDAPGAKAGRKIPGATSILTLPVASDGKKVEVDHIEANIDLSSTEDVDYFKDKIYNNSKLPKGYLVGEDVITTSQTLEAQDLKLKRALIPLKKAFLNGMMYLVENILAHAGYDVNKLEITVELNEPVQLSADSIAKYSDIVELLNGFKELNPAMPTVNQFQLLIKLGLPSELALLICSPSSMNVLPTADEISKLLLGQQIKDKAVQQELDNDELGESVSMRLTSKVFLNENTSLRDKLMYFTNANRTVTDRSLKESLLTYEKKTLTE
jgi:hypothetical protein